MIVSDWSIILIGPSGGTSFLSRFYIVRFFTRIEWVGRGNCFGLYVGCVEILVHDK
jgi:hypothetical protein